MSYPDDAADVDLIQRNSRTLRFRVYDAQNVPFPLDGFEAEFVVKQNIGDADTSARITKKSAGLPGGAADQIAFESLPPPGGGANVRYGILVYCRSADTMLDVGTYVYQIDVIKAVGDERFTVKQGTLQVLETAIKTI